MNCLIIYGTCGHGHKKAALYLEDELRLRPDVFVKSIDLLDYANPFTSIAYPFVYKFSVQYLPLLWKIGFFLSDFKIINPFIRIIRRVFNYTSAPKLDAFIRKSNPDVIVSTHFFAAEVSAALKRQGKVQSRIVTIVTDSKAHCTWINKGTDVYIGLSEDTKQSLLRWRIPEEKIQVLGIPISEKFEVQNNKSEMRLKFGLDDDKFTLLFTSGSFGLGPTEKILINLAQFRDKVQVIVVCGNNDSLFSALKSKNSELKIKVFPFIDFMDELMEAADLIVAKPGGLTMCESLAKETPLAITKPIPGQEEFNVDFLLSNDAAFRLSDPSDITAIVQSILNDHNILQTKISNIKKISKPKAASDIADYLLKHD